MEVTTKEEVEKIEYTYNELGDIGVGLKSIKDMIFDVDYMIEVGDAISKMNDIMQSPIEARNKVREEASNELEALQKEKGLTASEKMLKAQNINKKMKEDFDKIDNKKVSENLNLPRFTKQQLKEWASTEMYGNKKVHGDKTFILTPDFFVRCKLIID